jgi:hypothetical protein
MLAQLPVETMPLSWDESSVFGEMEAGSLTRIAIFETDGSIEQVDMLKAA